MKTWTNRLRLILVSALQVDRAVLFSATITVAAFVPLFTMQGVEGQIFGPMARTYGYALAGALIATFTITPVLASILLPAHVKEAETIVVRGAARDLLPGAAVVAQAALDHGWPRGGVPGRGRASWRRGWAANSCPRWRKAISGSAPRCRRRWT